MTKHAVPFSWKALLLAPLVIPVPAAAVFVGGSKAPFAALGVMVGLGYLFTLAVVSCLLLPALWLVSWVAEIKGWLTR